MPSADTELQNTLEIRAKALEIAAPKPDLAKGKKHDFEALFKQSFKRKIISAKMEKNPLTNHSRRLDAAIPIQFTSIYDVQLQKTIVFRTQPSRRATLKQPLQCVLQHQDPNPHLSTHMATQNDNNHAAITLRSATRESRNAKNYTRMNNHSLQNTEEEPIAPGSTAAAPAAHTRYFSSPAGATLHGKTQGFLPRLSPKTKPV